MDASKLFSVDDTSRTRSNGVKLRRKQVQLDNTEFFFTNDLVREWKKASIFSGTVWCDKLVQEQSWPPLPQPKYPIRVTYLTYCLLFDHVCLDYFCFDCFRKRLLTLRLDHLVWSNLSDLLPAVWPRLPWLLLLWLLSKASTYVKARPPCLDPRVCVVCFSM